MSAIKLFIPLLGIIVMVVIARWKRLPPEALGFTKPVARQAWIWMGIWLLSVVVQEVVIASLHLPPPKVWNYSMGVTLLRILSIGIIGPISEELAFRGVGLYTLRERLKVPVYAAVAIVAAAWAAIHLEKYSPADIAWIFFDGLILGMARVRSRSVIPPCIMHSIGNLLSIWESIHGVPW
jgi:uncharacterized protein